MRFLPDKFIGHYQTLHHHGQRHIQARPYLLPIFGLLLGAVIVAGLFYTRGGAQTFRPSDSHVVFLFNNGQKQTIDTKATTVGDLVHRLSLHLIPEDVVEPGLDTPIVEDNFRINVYHARPVTIVDGNTRTVTLTAQKSAREVAVQAGLAVKPEDLATFKQGDLKQNVIGEQVIVARATPVTLNLYGTQVPSYTQAKTVAALLDEKHIKLDNGETVNPSLKSPITSGMVLFILAKDTQVATAEESVPAPTQTVSDPTLSFGATVVRQKGAPGKAVVTYLVTSKKGEPPTRKLINQAIVQAPVPQIIARGTTIDINGDKTSLMAAAGIGAGDYPYVNYIVSHESGWCYTKGQGEYGTCTAYHGVPSYGGYGLCQSTPGSKMSSAGADWATSPVTQLRWCSNYASRYGGWAGSYNHWLAHHSW